jgi:RimJ/RimL family protein N-acetyltransferase
MLTAILRRVARVVTEDYWNGWLYVFEPSKEPPAPRTIVCRAIEDVTEIFLSQDQQLRIQGLPREEDAWAFGAWADNRLAAVCWFHARQTYRRHGGLFDLKTDEAELIQITTAAEFRGRGVATALIQCAAWEMGSAGFRRLYAKIWHDNLASVRAFERSGWKRTARFLSLRFRHVKTPLLFRFRVGPVV